MTLNPIPLRFKKKSSQGGATLAAVILAGLGSLAAVASIMAMINSAQEQALATHGATQSQSRAWLASEAIKRYLSSLNTTQLQALTTGSTITLTGLNGAKAVVMSNAVSANTGGQRIVIDTTGVGSVSTSVVESVYDVTPAASSAPGSALALPNSGVLMQGNINIDGNVTMTNPSSGTPPVLYATGTLNISSVNLTGVTTVCSAGDLTISSGVTVVNACTNGNLELSGGATVTGQATAIGNVNMDSGGSVGAIVTNGTVNMSTGTVNTISATGDVNLNNGGANANVIKSMGNVNWLVSSNNTTNINANGNVVYYGQSPETTTINALGNVTIDQAAGVSTIKTEGSVTVGTYGTTANAIYAKGGLSLTDEQSIVNGGIYGGTLSSYANYTQAWEGYNAANKTNNYNKAIHTTGYDPHVGTVSVPTISPFVPTSPVKVDVSTLAGFANYAFDVDSSNNIKVTIKNVNGIPNGTYFIGKYRINYGDYFDYYCNALDSNGYCTSPTSPTSRILAGYSSQNEALTYDPSTQTFTFAGTSMAQGVDWFNGNIQLSVGTFYNTFLATGNIAASSGTITVTAPNWAGYGPICQNATSGNYMPVTDFSGLYPTQFCNKTTGKYISSAIGNLTFMAGSYVNGVYKGGDVTMTDGNTSYGNIVAGDAFSTSGSTTIQGTIVASGLGGGTSHSFSGATAINQGGAPATFSDTTIICSSTCSSSSSTSSVKTYWTRYK